MTFITAIAAKGTPATGKLERLPCSAFVYVTFLPQSLFLSLLAFQRLSRDEKGSEPGQVHDQCPRF